MKIDEILENKKTENKIIFLKSILLGVKYGKMENFDYYEKSILYEIQKENIKENIKGNIQENIKENKKENKKENIKDDNKIFFLNAILLGIKYGKTENSDLYEKGILYAIRKENKKDENYTSQLLNQMDYKIAQFKVIKNIKNLENVRSNIIKNLNNLSYNNYNNNIVKINYLRNNLISLNQELKNLNKQLEDIHSTKISKS